MKKKQYITMEEHGPLRIRHLEGKTNRDFFDEIDYEISSILLELSNPVVFSSDSLCLPKWGRTQKRSTSAFLNLPKISPEPVSKSLPSTEVTSSSSCLTGEAKKTNSPQTTGLLRAHVAFVAHQPMDDQNLLHLQPLTSVDRRANVRDVETASSVREARDNMERRGFDLNLPAPAAEEEDNSIAAMVGFQRVATEVKAAAAQARQRRLALMRSKKLYNRFISSYQFN